MRKFEDTAAAGQSHPQETTAGSAGSTSLPVIDAPIHWTDDVRTRDYYPTRFEYIFKDVLCGMLSRTAPKDEEKCIQRALNFTRLVEDALDTEAR